MKLFVNRLAKYLSHSNCLAIVIRISNTNNSKEPKKRAVKNRYQCQGHVNIADSFI